MLTSLCNSTVCLQDWGCVQCLLLGPAFCIMYQIMSICPEQKFLGNSVGGRGKFGGPGVL